MKEITIFPVTEAEISLALGREVKSPILCASLDYFGLDVHEFVDHFKPSFEHMPWDYYDVKRRQWDMLPKGLKKTLAGDFKEYYLDDQADDFKFVLELPITPAERRNLLSVKPWRRRSVCTFEITVSPEIRIERLPGSSFEQQVKEKDIRSLPRRFEETDAKLVQNQLFIRFMLAVVRQTQAVCPHLEIGKVQLTAHFMSVKAREKQPGNNAPEGMHEDGADFIVSALVVNRQNITGAKSQVTEKMPDGNSTLLYERELQEGEFLFQADTGEEKIYGNDLWHYITPFYVDDPKKEAWRDIIGFDIAILEARNV